MELTPLIAFSSIFVLGIGAQWLAWQLRLPSILLLLTVGFLAGLVGVVDPDAMFGDLLFPLVTISVALVLFEGAMQLSRTELQEIGGSLSSLLTIGVVVTWLLATVAAMYILWFPFPEALLIGALLTVTGPTVIGPILRQVRPFGRVGPIARWEGIVIDPIGAILAVLVFEVQSAVRMEEFNEATVHAIVTLVKTVVVGFSLGTIAAVVLGHLLRRHQIADHLQSPVTLLFVVLTCAVSNTWQHESGLIAVVWMGIILANMSGVNIRHIYEFKENLSVLLISSLFILLAARLKLDQFTALGWRGPAFVVWLIIVVRPVAVFLSTWRGNLTFRQKVFLACLAPRGIVAAAVASVFALQLGDTGEELTAAVFLVIVGTVITYGLAAPPLARKLGIAFERPQGALIASAHPGARAIAHAVYDAGYPVVLVDTNRDHIAAARMEGLPVHQGNILSEHSMASIELGGIGRLIALTPNDEVNALAALHYADLFGRAEVYQLVPAEETQGEVKQTRHLRGRRLFAADVTYTTLDELFEAGGTLKKTKLGAHFSYQQFLEKWNNRVLLLFVIDENGRLHVCTAEEPRKPTAGEMVIAIVNWDPEKIEWPKKRAERSENSAAAPKKKETPPARVR